MNKETSTRSPEEKLKLVTDFKLPELTFGHPEFGFFSLEFVRIPGGDITLALRKAPDVGLDTFYPYDALGITEEDMGTMRKEVLPKLINRILAYVNLATHLPSFELVKKLMKELGFTHHSDIGPTIIAADAKFENFEEAVRAAYFARLYGEYEMAHILPLCFIETFNVTEWAEIFREAIEEAALEDALSEI